MLSSKEVLEQTGISRATLNNYISSGIVSRPEVLPPGPQDGGAPRIGYFQPGIVERIEEIQRLKREGWSLARITEHFAAGAPARTAPPRHPAGRSDARRILPPTLTPVAVLFSELQDASRLWSELPPEDYFELINDIWLAVDPIFKRHGGAKGIHPGEGLVCYFLPRAGSNYLWDALVAAQQVREATRRLGKQWQLRKRWSTELYMNTGIAEGLEWHGTLRPGSGGEFTVLGDAVDHAAGTSGLARHGAVWTTRNLVGKLRPDERRRLVYGVRRPERQGAPAPIRSVFARVESLADLAAPGNEALRTIGRLAVTEVFEIPGDVDAAGRTGTGPLV